MTSMETQYQQAEELFRQGNISDAEKLCVDILKETPDSHHILHLLGIIAFTQKNYQRALQCLQRAVNLNENDPVYHNHLGNLLRVGGDTASAMAHYQRALTIQPEFAEAANNLGNICYQNGGFQEALKHYQTAVELQMEYVDARLNMAYTLVKLTEIDAAIKQLNKVVTMSQNADLLLSAELLLAKLYYQQNEYQQSVDHCQQALKFSANNFATRQLLAHNYLLLCDFDNAIRQYSVVLEQDATDTFAHYNMGTLLLGKRNLDAAAFHFRQVLQYEPEHFDALVNLAAIDLTQGKQVAALELYNKALLLRPDDVNVKYTLTALQQSANPRQAPAEYIKPLFDSYAHRYDQHLQQELDYQTPQFVYEQVKKIYQQRQQRLRILDLGCGTGLAGTQLTEFSSHLTGVDLSPRMLEIAHYKECYDELIEDDIEHYLTNCDDSYDIIIAADVFIYFGELKSILPACQQHLTAQGSLLFSVEKHVESEAYHLQNTGRYTHSRNYLEQVLQESSLLLQHCDAVKLRQQQEEEVTGYFVIAQKIETT